MNNKVSIIVPFYNIQEEFLNDCMDSLLNQTYKNIEILLVDDGSKPEFGALLNKYRNNNKVKILRKENGGVASARNVGMAYMTGDWCMFVDPDDWLEKDCVENFVSVVEQQPEADYVLSKVNLIERNFSKENTCTLSKSQFVDPKNVVRDIIINNNPQLTCTDTVWAKLYNVDFLKKNRLFFDATLRSGEDVPFSLDCTFNASKIYFLNKATYNYRYNNFSECRTCKALDSKSTAMLRAIGKILSKNNMLFSGYYDYYVLRVINRLLRKHYNNYESKDTFANDFSKLLQQPEYKFVLSNPNTKFLESNKMLLLNTCKEKQFNKLFSSIKKNQVQK